MTARIDSIGRLLRSGGAYLMLPDELNSRLNVDAAVWARFGSHWCDLAPDVYAAEAGTRRLRRYGHFLLISDDRTFRPMPHRAFVQPQDSNPLYLDRDRHFEPLTDSFTEDPVLHGVLGLLGGLATALADIPQWSVKVTPFRVLASAGDKGQPTPEGMHRDGVTLVSSLLISRDNAVGGQSTVVDADKGRRLLATTLAEPGTMLLGDDRRTLHGVSPIRPRDPSRAARRDVLVVTFAPLDAP